MLQNTGMRSSQEDMFDNTEPLTQRSPPRDTSMLEKLELQEVPRAASKSSKRGGGNKAREQERQVSRSPKKTSSVAVWFKQLVGISRLTSTEHLGSPATPLRLPERQLLSICEKQVAQSQPQPIVQRRERGIKRVEGKLTRPRAATPLVFRRRVGFVASQADEKLQARAPGNREILGRQTGHSEEKQKAPQAEPQIRPTK